MTRNFELGPETRFLRQHLRKLEKDELASYRDLSLVVGKPVNGASHTLQSAIRGLLREGLVFATIRGVGIKRLTDAQIVSAADRDITSVRRRSKRAAKKLVVSDYQKLTAKQQLEHTAKISIMGAIASMTSDRAIAAIEKVASGRSGELPIAETIKALSK
jgi:hypothetical protein